jgi:hypothetical protein
MKVIFNYATRQFESMEPTLRDRFQLGGRVNYAEAGFVFGNQKFNVDIPNLTPVQSKSFQKGLKDLEKWLKNPNAENWIETFRTPSAKGQTHQSEFSLNLRKYIQGQPVKTRAKELFDSVNIKNLLGDTVKDIQTYTPQEFRRVSNLPKSVKAAKVALDKSMKAANAVRDVFVRDVDADLEDVARGIFGKDFDNASLVVKENMLSKASDDTAKFLEAVSANRKVKGFKPISADKLGDIIANIEDNTKGFKFREGTIREYRFRIRDSLLGIETESAQGFRNLRNVIGGTDKGKVVDEVFGLSATFKNAPGYVENVQLIDKKINNIKGKQIDKPFTAIVNAVKNKKDVVQYEGKETNISEAIKKFNAKSKAFSNKNKISTPQIFVGDNLDATKLVSNFDKYSPEAQKNILKNAEEGFVLNSTRPATPAGSFKQTSKIKTGAKKGLKFAAKQIPLLGTLIGTADAATAFKQGVRDPRDLYTAFEVSPEVALKQKAIREDPTGKLLKEEIANLPEITTDDQVAGALMDSFPNQSFLQYQSAVDDGFQGSFEEYLQQQSMKMASGGRVGFKDGTPDPFVDQLLAALESTKVADQFIKDNSPSVGEMVFGKDGDRTLVQSFNTQFLDPRAFPYYGAKTLEGVTRIPEYMLRTIPALGDAVAGAIQGRPRVFQDLLKNLSPEFTDKLQKDFGLKKLIQDLEKDRTNPQKLTGGLLEFAGEIPGPVTPFILFKQFPKLKKQLEDLVGTGKAMEQVNREIEKKGAVDQTRRDIVLSIGAGGAVGLLKYLGLDNLFKVAPKVVEKAAPEIITKGGTPKYFFDFVNLIKSKGDDISEKAATIERQKVYDYNGYTLTEQLDTGKINIRKETEGGGSYSIGDGEYETIEGIMKVEEINYNPPETIINDKGKSVRVPDDYSEDIAVPDIDGGLGDVQPGLDSIDEVLELLAKDGKKYSLDELIEMGVSPEGIGDDFLLRILKDPSELKITKIRSKFDKKLDAIRKERSNKAGGGIMKMAGDESGPPPKSGPTPHGLPYVAKNVKPIKERK